MVFRNNLTELKKKVKCKPRDTLVEIVAPPGIIVSRSKVELWTSYFPCFCSKILPELPSTKISITPITIIVFFCSQYFPNTVLVKRCGGACNRCKCISTETKNVTFYVNTIQATKRSCSSISLPEDTKCKCGCEKKIDCPGKQRYDDVRRKCACPVCQKQLFSFHTHLLRFALARSKRMYRILQMGR